MPYCFFHFLHILIHLQVKKVRPYIEMLEDHFREMRSVERKLETLKKSGKTAPTRVVKNGVEREVDEVAELSERLLELELAALEPTWRLKRRIDQVRLHYAEYEEAKRKLENP